MRNGFIYIWYDTKRKLFYIGSHEGTEDDGYVCSNSRMRNAYNKRPETFKRKILERISFEHRKELLQREQYWLNMIKPEELHGKKYYNMKLVAEGGDIISTLPEAKRIQHKMKAIENRKKGWKKWAEENKTRVKEIASIARNSWTEESYRKNAESTSKNAIIVTPIGETIIVNNIRKFCRDHDLNYGIMKNVLRGNTRNKSIKGYRGNYV